MRRKYVLGIDGGGTKTHAILADINDNVVGEFYGGSSNLLAADIELVKNNMHKLLTDVKNYLAKENISLYAVCIGSAGLTYPDAKNILGECITQNFHDVKVLVVGDMQIALEAGIDEEGILLISGTGSICCGKNANDVFARSGGWGQTGSDEGSGYWISLQAFIRLLNELDEICEKSGIGEMLMDITGFLTPAQVSVFLNDKTTDKAKIASYCPIIDKSALAGDITAVNILVDAGERLFTLINSVRKKLGLSGKFPIVLAGSVAKNSIHIIKHITQRCNEMEFGTVKILDKPSAYGAIKLIRKHYDFR